MKIFPTVEIPEIDEYTINHLPISSIDLMERAAKACSLWIMSRFQSKQSIVVLVGPGNNGGDGFAIARQLSQNGYDVDVYVFVKEDQLSDLSRQNLDRLYSITSVPVFFTTNEADSLTLISYDIVIDTLFGSGLNRPIEGRFAKLVQYVNSLHTKRIAIDIPSGLMGEFNSDGITSSIIRAHYTLTFQFPKLSLLFPETSECVGKLEVLDIGLHPAILEEKISDWEQFTTESASKCLMQRSLFSHKGNFGHALLVAGSYGKMGAAILAAKATLRAGAGLLTVHVPGRGYDVLQNSFPEAMVSIDQSDLMFSEVADLDPFSCIGIGPGLGTKTNTQRGFLNLLQRNSKPIVVDADALNILADHPDWIDILPSGSILTPHLGEFRRLVGDFDSGFERMQAAINLAARFDGVVIVKGANTMINTSYGKVYFNTTGNPGMATAGSGDVLTGILLGLLSCGYKSVDAACLGVYLHGLAGDIGAEQGAFESLIASDLIQYLPKAFQYLHKVEL